MLFLITMTKYLTGDMLQVEVSMLAHGLRKDTGHYARKATLKTREAAGHTTSTVRKQIAVWKWYRALRLQGMTPNGYLIFPPLKDSSSLPSSTTKQLGTKL